ncbi:DUF4282 domain-containing protein [Ornithinimicrobium sp. Arc0846-15]|nr:DUF4282 domain-containing protein [Ornithinimicrobium laminariae]
MSDNSFNSSEAANQAQGFMTALFDWRFRTFVTPKVVPVVYILTMFVGAFYFLFILVAAFRIDLLAGFFTLIFGPLGMLLWLVFVRMTLEFYLAIVRMSDDIHDTFGPGRR